MLRDGPGRVIDMTRDMERDRDLQHTRATDGRQLVDGVALMMIEVDGLTAPMCEKGGDAAVVSRERMRHHPELPVPAAEFVVVERARIEEELSLLGGQIAAGDQTGDPLLHRLQGGRTDPFGPDDPDFMIRQARIMPCANGALGHVGREVFDKRQIVAGIRIRRGWPASVRCLAGEEIGAARPIIVDEKRTLFTQPGEERRIESRQIPEIDNGACHSATGVGSERS